MAYLINRNPAARFECLHALVRFIYDEFGINNSFSLSSVQFDRNHNNIHKFCSMLETNKLGLRYCPYKQNPLDDAGCSLTNGKYVDTTKLKEVGNTLNALHGLDFVNRGNRNVRITNFGVEFAMTDYRSHEMHLIIKKAVLNYGPIIGVLKQICDVEQDKHFETNDIIVGYPNTSEQIKYNDVNVIISSGSQRDSNTRTRSCLLAWLTTAGYIKPISLPPLDKDELPHIKYRDFINLSHRGERAYEIINMPEIWKDGSFLTNKPLDYNNLTKLTRALRENNMALVREVTMASEGIINNRRYAILYILNKASKENKAVCFKDIIAFFLKNKKFFIISDQKIETVLKSELSIADMSGIPFEIKNKDGTIYLKPLTTINLNELSIGVPNDLVKLLEKVKV